MDPQNPAQSPIPPAQFAPSVKQRSFPVKECIIFLSVFIIIFVILSFRLVVTGGAIDLMQLINLPKVAIPILLLETPLIAIFAWRSKHAKTITGRIFRSFGFTLLYILLLVVLSAANQFINNQMIVTKTYTSNYYTFQLKYPFGWTAYEHKYSRPRSGLEYSRIIAIFFLPPSVNIDSNKRAIDSGGQPPNTLTITIGNKYSTEALHQTGNANFMFGSIKYEQITFARLPARKSYITATDTNLDTGTTDINFNNGNYGWTISYPNTDLKGNHSQIFDQILSTFKFTQ